MRFFIFSSRELNPDYKSKAIMLAMGVNYSHVGVIVSSGENETIFHATGEGTHNTSVSDFLRTHDFTHKFEVTDFVNDKERALGWLEGNLGKDYSETQLVAIVIKMLPKWVRWFFKKIIDWLQTILGDGERESICSELCVRFLSKHSSIEIFNSEDADFIDPKQVVEALEAFFASKEEAN